MALSAVQPLHSALLYVYRYRCMRRGVRAWDWPCAPIHSLAIVQSTCRTAAPVADAAAAAFPPVY